MSRSSSARGGGQAGDLRARATSDLGQVLYDASLEGIEYLFGDAFLGQPPLDQPGVF